MEDKIYLVLQNGQVFSGKPFGAIGDAIGEMVFTTGMTGYIETLTDPSYYGQIVMQTFPLIGNYGTMIEDMESTGSCVRGYVVREWCNTPSNFRSEGDIDSFLKVHNIVGIYDVDTRELTKIIREYGVMNARITRVKPTCNDDIELSNYKVANSVQSVTTDKMVEYKSANSKHKIALIDYGTKQNIIRSLVERGVSVTVYPASVEAQTILDGGYDGVMLGNGPGDPEENEFAIAQIARIMGKLPIFAICLGHQLLALANGSTTSKLKYGHRGVNQPVKNVTTGRVYITSQNHGYAVDMDSLKAGASILYINVNDGTCEGIEYKGKNAFSVQFHPEGSAGTKDTGYLFDEFVSKIEEVKNAVK